MGKEEETKTLCPTNGIIGIQGWPDEFLKSTKCNCGGEYLYTLTLNEWDSKLFYNNGI